MPRRKITLIGVETRLDRMRWVSVLGTTAFVAVWEVVRRLFLPQLEWISAVATIGLAFLLANAASILVVQIIQTLQARIERQNQEMAALNAVIQTASSSLDLETIMEGVLEEVAKATGMEVGLSWLRGPRRGHSARVLHNGLSPAFVQALNDEGLVEKLYQAGPRSGHPLFITPHDKTYTSLVVEAVAQAQGPRTLVLFPIVSKNLVLGMLGAGSYRDWKLTDEETSLLSAIGQQIGQAVENAWLYEDVRNLSLGAVRSLAAAVDARDPYTKGHSEEVSRLAVAMAKELGWREQDLELLEYAALLHDVGKIGVPDQILRKPGPLTPEEWEEMYRHPSSSAQIVGPVDALERIVPWIYHHQERWDGTGYPDGLRGEEIPLASRILAVVDAYAAMTSSRPYRGAMSHEEAVAELRHYTDTQFDPRVVEAFIRIIAARRKEQVPA